MWVRVDMRGTARWKLRIVERLLANRTREARRQFARRIHLAEEHIGNRGASFNPGLQASRIAGTCSAAHFNSSGRPASTTRITGFPVATTPSAASPGSR